MENHPTQKVPAILIQQPEDIRKLIGCVIEDARIVNLHAGVCIEIDVSHTMAPNPVSVRIEPKAEITVSQGGIIAVGGSGGEPGGAPLTLRNTLMIWTKDIPPKN